MLFQTGTSKRNVLRNFFTALLGAAAILGVANSAQAGVFLEIQQGDGPAVFSEVSSSFVNSTAINVGDYQINVTAGSSNVPGSSVNAILELTELSVTRLTGTSTAALSIRLLANNFFNPAGNPLYMKSSASAEFTNASDADSVEFISYFNTHNSSSYMAGAAADVVALASGDGSLTTTERVDRLHPAFSLSNVTLIDLKAIGSSVNTTGSTVVGNQPFDPETRTIPNPEPTSLVLLACGGLGVIGTRLRSRKRHVS